MRAGASQASLEERDFNPARSHLVRLDAGQEQHARCLKGEMHLWEREKKKKTWNGERNESLLQPGVCKGTYFEFTGSETTKAEEI